MSPSRNSRPRFAIIGDPTDERVAAFEGAVAAHGLDPATVIDYRTLLAGRLEGLDALDEGTIVRLESPGRSQGIHRLILERGAAPAITSWKKGRVVYPRHWYHGFQALTREIFHRLLSRNVHFTFHPRELLVVFNKSHCHDYLRVKGFRVAPGLRPVSGFDELRARMECSGRKRVFVKLLYGSAASGIVAYETTGRGGREQAFTTVEAVDEGNSLALYNTRRVRRVRDSREIARIVDALCEHGVHVEAWVPKAGIHGRRFDLRILTVAGEPAHTVVRSSTTPMTNLHLLNERASAEDVRARMGEEAWESLMATARGVAALFPCSLHLGLDVIVPPGFRSHVVVEVNAFGDWLKGVFHEGLSPHEYEVRALLREAAAA